MDRTDRVNEQNRIKILQQKKKRFGLNRIEKDCFIPRMLNGNSFQYVKRITWHPFFFFLFFCHIAHSAPLLKYAMTLSTDYIFLYIVSPSTFIFPIGCFLLFLFAKILFFLCVCIVLYLYNIFFDTNAPIDLIYFIDLHRLWIIVEYEMNSEIDALNLFDTNFFSTTVAVLVFANFFSLLLRILTIIVVVKTIPWIEWNVMPVNRPEYANTTLNIVNG